MSRAKGKTGPNDHCNCVTKELQSTKDKALAEKKKHDSWEKKQRFEVRQIDAKTVTYRLIKQGKKVKSNLIHRGKI